MNENEMLNPTAVETNEAAVAAAPEENVNAAPVSEPQEAKEATEAPTPVQGIDIGAELTEKMPTDKLVDISPMALRMSSPFNSGYWLSAA